VLKIYPEIILSAIRTKKPVGGVRLYCLFKAANTSGNGNMRAVTFKDYCRKSGVKKSRYNRWLRYALNMGILSRTGETLSAISWGKAAVRCGIQKPLQIACDMPAERIVEARWAAWVWAAYLLLHKDRPISRNALEELTGVPDSTQRRYEVQAGVVNQANYADYGFPDQDPDNAIAEEGNGYFWYHGRMKKRLPNTRIVKGVFRCSRGRMKKYNRAILQALSLWGGGHKINKLYHHTLRSLKRTLRSVRKDNQDHKTRADVVFLHAADHQGVGLWGAVPC